MRVKNVVVFAGGGLKYFITCIYNSGGLASGLASAKFTSPRNRVCGCVRGSLNGYARCAKVALERMKMTIQINLLCIIFSGRKRRSKKSTK